MSAIDHTEMAFSLTEHVRLAVGIAARALTRLEQWDPDSPEVAADVHAATTALALLARDLRNEAGRRLG